MIIELGHFSLIIAMMLSLVQSIVPIVGAKNGWYNWMRTYQVTAPAQFLLTSFSFATLVYAFVISDFSVALVVSNSHTLKPLLYKISGTWGNHEGSMLLWVLILTFYGFLVAYFGKNLPITLKSNVLSVQSMITFAFFGFVLFTSNPFERIIDPPFDGNGLNPLLQDPGLAFHPPFLYLGYVGLSITFSFAIAALLEGRVDAAWARWVRPWALTAWMFLTIGIAMGSWWAYYELGWGGWWFWDPVENASFMPWLIAAALLHSSIVVEKRNTLKSWTILLAIIAFSFSLIGTFIVRSGVITSVHAFANDPTRGVFILAIIIVTVGLALILFTIRAPSLRSNSYFGLVSRESSLVVNNLLLSVSALIVFIGTIWPLLVEIVFKEKISVGEPFFTTAFTPFMVLLACILPIGSSLTWKRARLTDSVSKLWSIACFSIVAGALTWSFQTGGRILGPVGITLAFWIIAGALSDLAVRIKLFQLDKLVVINRFIGLPRSEFGKTVAHIGFGLIIFGISAVTAWEIEDIRTVKLNEPFKVSKYEINLKRVDSIVGPNYQTKVGLIIVNKDGSGWIKLMPEKRFYPVQDMATTEASINTNLFRDLYVVLGDQQDDGSWVVRTYIKPFVVWIWIGALVMSFGGVLSLSDRKYRLGFVNKRNKKEELFFT
jgi:cytochrome c-type biogenesis protein CcmF